MLDNHRAIRSGISPQIGCVGIEIDGKAVQANTFEDAEGNNVLNSIEVRFVKPSE